LIQYQIHGRKRSDFFFVINQFSNCFCFFSNLQACFDYLHGLVKGSQSEPLLLCILSRIICIRDDQAVRLVISKIKKNSFNVFQFFSYSYLRLIDECIQRIVFSKTSCDPDFDTYSMDSESIGDSGVPFSDNTSSIPGGSLHDFSHAANNLQATENEIQIDLMKGRVEHLENIREKLTKALETVLTKVKKELMRKIDCEFGFSIG
jgi:hypothetical protein